jgi:hypothetical protein
MKDTFKQSIEEFKKKEEELVNFIRGNFGQACKEFFDTHPTLESFAWKQYTVYFNDGDECYFSARCDGERIGINNKRYKEQTEDDRITADEVSHFLYSIGDDMLEKIFGDHKEIIVTKDGVTIEIYTDHD